MRNPTASDRWRKPVVIDCRWFARGRVGEDKGPMLGIDVSKDTLACARLDSDSRKVLWELTVPNSPAGVQQLLRRMPHQEASVMEPTGRYSTKVAVQLNA